MYKIKLKLSIGYQILQLTLALSLFILSGCPASNAESPESMTQDSSSIDSEDKDGNVISNNGQDDYYADAGSVGATAFGEPKFTNPACTPSAITFDGNQKCAICENANDESTFSICSEVRNSRCQQQETADGQICQRCLTEDDQVLYDDCGLIHKQESSYCETSVLNQNNEDMACLLCYDDKDWVIEKSCFPLGTNCENIRLGDSTCTECTLNNELVSRSCEFTDIDPSFCSEYSNSNGRCVDCFDASDQLLLHSCSTATDDIGVCHNYTTTENDSCSYCLDRDGLLLSSECIENKRESLYCEELDFPAERCTLCLDEYNQVNRIQCEAKSPPSRNFNSQDCILLENDLNSSLDRQQICLTCPSNSPEELLETRCLSIQENELKCEMNEVEIEVPDSSADGMNGSQVGFQQCLQCISDNSVVHQQCENEGPIVAPICKQTFESVDTLCTVCSDPINDTVLFQQCQNLQCSLQDNLSSDGYCTSCYAQEQSMLISESCGPQQCDMNFIAPIFSEQGNTYRQVNGSTTDSNQENGEKLYMDCEQCSAQGETEYFICRTSFLCEGELSSSEPPPSDSSNDQPDNGGGGNGDSPGPETDAGTIYNDVDPNDIDNDGDSISISRDGIIHFEMGSCENAVQLKLEHSVCAQEWDIQASQQNTEPLGKIFAWMLDNHLHPYEIQLTDQQNSVQECENDPCLCTGARTLNVFIPMEEANIAYGLGFN